MKFLLKLIITAAVAYGLANVLEGVSINSFGTAIVFALLLAFLNGIVKPLLIILTIPVTILTLGLFLLVINACMILMADYFLEGISVSGFWWALIFSIVLSIVTGILGSLFETSE